MPDTDCGVIILAAGSSSRLGSPKQWLMFKGKTLLAHSIDEAIASKTGEVMVVTGAGHDSILSSLPGKMAHFVYNTLWQQGMASSMQAGLTALLTTRPNLDSVIIMLCDQPFVSASLLQKMTTEKRTTGKGIVACAYEETVGVPALFSRSYFNALLSLNGAEGARKIIAANGNDTAVILFPSGAIDIDTAEDYEKLIN